MSHERVWASCHQSNWCKKSLITWITATYSIYIHMLNASWAVCSAPLLDPFSNSHSQKKETREIRRKTAMYLQTNNFLFCCRSETAAVASNLGSVPLLSYKKLDIPDSTTGDRNIWSIQQLCAWRTLGCEGALKARPSAVISDEFPGSMMSTLNSRSTNSG